MTTADERGEVRMGRAHAPADGQAVIALSGELDLAAADGLNALLSEVLAETPRLVVVDIAEVSFADSTILRELLRAHQSVRRAGGRLILAAPQAGVNRLLELTGTAAVFELAGSRREALV